MSGEGCPRTETGGILADEVKYLPVTLKARIEKKNALFLSDQLLDASLEKLRTRFLVGALEQPSKPRPQPKRTYPESSNTKWIEIPAGRGQMEASDDKKTVTLKIPNERYWIAKYPVTHAQFSEFIRDGGYTKEDLWTPEGWKIKEEGWRYNKKKKQWNPSKSPWMQPILWKNEKFDSPDQPVIGVSWYEATAYCLWLRRITGMIITLPTQAQWQYAAQGDGKRTYPWGNRWNSKRCNTSESKIEQTTLVHAYEGKGDSPFGVVDMSGNIWEWCLTNYENGENILGKSARFRVMRGGSWYSDRKDARVASISSSQPMKRASDWGFRLCRVEPI